MDTFEPTILAFVCNWCTYTAADLAGTSRLTYPINVRLEPTPFHLPNQMLDGGTLSFGRTVLV